MLYNIKKLGFFVLAIILGIISLIIGIQTNATKDLYDSAVTATVVDIEEEKQMSSRGDGDYEIVKNAYIDYEADGKKYAHILSPVQNDDLKIGDTVEILYQSGNPKEVASPDVGTTAVILIAVGAVVTFGTIAFLVFVFIKERK